MTTTKPETRSDLLARIAKALKDKGATAASLYDLAAEAQRAVALAGIDATNARQRALDPGLPQEDVALALGEKTAAEFDAERIEAAMKALSAKADTLRDDEIEAARRANYDAVAADTKRVAERLQSEFPALQAGLVDLLDDLARNNLAVDEANRRLPSGYTRIQRAEGRARGFNDLDDMGGGGAPYNIDIMRLSQMVVPDFSDPGSTAWPVRRPIWFLNLKRVQLPSHELAHTIWQQQR